MDSSALDHDYGDQPLLRANLPSEPLALFRAWFENAVEADIREPHAMALATVDTGGRPSCRYVLLKVFDQRGFSFFTNYRSRKATELDARPVAAATLWWPALERQVRLVGPVAKTTVEESDDYWRSRGRGSQIASAASLQSSVLPAREVYASRIAELDASSAETLPRPADWGGYRLSPDEIEFWQGRRNRAHDRFRYVRDGDEWSIERLYP